MPAHCSRKLPLTRPSKRPALEKPSESCRRMEKFMPLASELLPRKIALGSTLCGLEEKPLKSQPPTREILLCLRILQLRLLKPGETSLRSQLPSPTFLSTKRTHCLRLLTETRTSLLRQPLCPLKKSSPKKNHFLITSPLLRSNAKRKSSIFPSSTSLLKQTELSTRSFKNSCSSRLTL